MCSFYSRQRPKSGPGRERSGSGCCIGCSSRGRAITCTTASPPSPERSRCCSSGTPSDVPRESRPPDLPRDDALISRGTRPGVRTQTCPVRRVRSARKVAKTQRNLGALARVHRRENRTGWGCPYVRSSRIARCPNEARTIDDPCAAIDKGRAEFSPRKNRALRARKKESKRRIKGIDHDPPRAQRKPKLLPRLAGSSP